MPLPICIALPNLPFYGTTLPTKGVSSPSVTVLSRAVTHRDTAAMPGWFNRAATGQLAGPRSAAMPSPARRAGRSYYLRGQCTPRTHHSGERPLRSPALQQVVRSRARRADPGRPERPALVRPLSGLRNRDQIQHVSGHQVLRARVPCNQVAVPPAEREHVAAIEGDRGRRCGNKLGEQAPASPVPAARGARCGRPLIS
jgi:hypothetical protein